MAFCLLLVFTFLPFSSTKAEFAKYVGNLNATISHENFGHTKVAWISFSGRHAAIFAGSSSTHFQAGDVVEILGNSPQADGRHTITSVQNSNLIKIALRNSAGVFFGGWLVKIFNGNKVVGKNVFRCPAGYYCRASDDTPLECGSPRFYCPMGSIYPQKVYEGVINEGAYYSIGGNSPTVRHSQAVCPVGSYCKGGERFLCPAGRFGNIEGDSRESCSGPCAPGHYCPEGSYTATQHMCGPPSFYCPLGSAQPLKSPDGYYTWNATKIEGGDRHHKESLQPILMTPLRPEQVASLYSTTHSAIALCTPGSYCLDGVRRLCPRGRYSSESGNSKPGCEGKCMAGYYCKAGSSSPVQHRCGGAEFFCPEGSHEPLPVHPGYYTRSLSRSINSCAAHDCPNTSDVHSHEFQCEMGHYCSSGVRHPCPAGTYGGDWGLQNSSCSGICDPGYYCPTGSSSPQEHECGGVGHYCPAGSSAPSTADRGFFTAGFTIPLLHHEETSSGGNWSSRLQLVFPILSSRGGRTRVFKIVKSADNSTMVRVRQLQCQPGYYCSGGKRQLCPAGRYGDTAGLSSDACSGISRAGYFAPPGTENATQYACGDPGYYCPEGSATPRPVLPGWYTNSPEVVLVSTASECHGENVSGTACSSGAYHHDAMHLRMPNDRGGEMIRSEMKICPPGSFCPGLGGNGRRWEMPPGRYGRVAGISDHLGAGTGQCRAGFYCVAGSISPTAHRCGSSIVGSHTDEVQVISISPDCKEDTSSCEVTGSFSIGLDTTSRSDVHRVEWLETREMSNSTCRWPCKRSRLPGFEALQPPLAVSHDATASQVRDILQLLPNIGKVRVTRTMLSAEYHTYAWSVTFVSLHGDVPPLLVAPNGADYTFSTPELQSSPNNMQNMHAAVHSQHGPLRGGFLHVTEEIKGVATVTRQARGADVFCPESSGNPTPVSRGYYTSVKMSFMSETINEKFVASDLLSNGNVGSMRDMASEQKVCDLGHWCYKGLRDACPRGRYGGQRGLDKVQCSGPCAPGHICPYGSHLATQITCGFGLDEPSSVYCPSGLLNGSWKPTSVTPGYYTTGGEGTLNLTRSAQSLCEEGHYCLHGRKIRCPSGRYGGTQGLKNSSCTGTCDPGYFCPQGSSSARQIECGSEWGVRAPCVVTGMGLTSLVERSGERRCEDDHGIYQKQTHSQGTGHFSVHHQETEDYSTINPRQYHYHTSTFHTSRVRLSGTPGSVYCPEGSSIPRQVTAGYYTTGGNETTNRTRHSQMRVEPGYFAEQGRKYRCPPGRYGNAYGLSTEFCTGFCPAGFYCPWNTSDPLPCPHGTYTSPGSFACITCPQRPGSMVSATTCKTGRHCCFK